MTFYGDVESAYTALTAGQIDALGYEMTRELFDISVNDPNIILSLVSDSGMYYAVDFVLGSGGHLVLKRNPYYWMATPPLGDIDWAWQWKSRPKPCNGNYKIGIFDVVTITSKYGQEWGHS